MTSSAKPPPWQEEDPEDERTGATRAWMRAQCPLINRQDLFNANYLGAEPTEYTLRTASESHRTDVLGYDLAEYNLTFVAQLPFGRELKPNLDAADFFAALSAWVRGQERTHNYPAVSGYRVTKITASKRRCAHRGGCQRGPLSITNQTLS